VVHQLVLFNQLLFLHYWPSWREFLVGIAHRGSGYAPDAS